MVRKMMRYSEEVRIRSIIARAIPLWERDLGGGHHAAPPDLIRARRRLERWQRLLGGADLLNRRLHSSDLPAARLENVLGAVEGVADGAFPSWASTLASI